MAPIKIVHSYLPVVRALLLVAGAFFFAADVYLIFFENNLYHQISGTHLDLPLAMNQSEFSMYQIISFQSSILGIVLLFFSILSFFSAWLCKQVTSDNSFTIVKGKNHSLENVH